MNYVIFITRNLENVPGKCRSGKSQGKVREKFCSKSVGTLHLSEIENQAQ